MNVALWVVQFVVAAAFGMSGVMKATMPIAALEPLPASVPRIATRAAPPTGAS